MCVPSQKTKLFNQSSTRWKPHTRSLLNTNCFIHKFSTMFKMNNPLITSNTKSSMKGSSCFSIFLWNVVLPKNCEMYRSDNSLDLGKFIFKRILYCIASYYVKIMCMKHFKMFTFFMVDVPLFYKRLNCFYPFVFYPEVFTILKMLPWHK